MPKRRPMELLRKLGRRMKARRIHIGRTQPQVAAAAEISKVQYGLYERGEGHPPAATLHRIALALNTTTSALLGEREDGFDGRGEQFDLLSKLYTHPTIGTVTRAMQDMSKEDRARLQLIAVAFAERHRNPSRAKVMT